MFVPIGLLIQDQEKILRSSYDMIEALDRWVLPRYPKYTTMNPAYTRQECMGVLRSFYAAGKIHLAVTPKEVVDAVEAFMEDRLWVSKTSLDQLGTLGSHSPYTWLRQPNLLSCVSAVFKTLYNAATTLLGIPVVALNIIVYAFIPRPKLKVPKHEKSSGDSKQNS